MKDKSSVPVRGGLWAGTPFLLLTLLLVAIFYPAGSVSAQAEPEATNVGGDIVADTTWTVAGSPYIVTSNVRVAEGVKLTIQPGVEVRFQQFRRLTIEGTLDARGTANNPILFTGTTKQPGWWDSIHFDGAQDAVLTTSVLDHVIVEYGGSGPASIYLDYTVLPITNSIVRHSGGDAIYAYVDSVAHLTNVEAHDNDGYVLELLDGGLDPQLSGITASGNQFNSIGLGGGTLTGDAVWENVGIPYRILGNLLVDEGVTLTIEPGTQVWFHQFRRLTVEGTLDARGTEGEPILFTGSTKQPGWWDAIYIDGTQDAPLTTTVLDHVIIEYGGSSTASLYLTHATVPVSNSIVRHSAHDGIYGYVNGLAHLTNVELSNNGGFPYELLDGGLDPELVEVRATNNISNGIGLGAGTFTGEVLWENIGIPVVLLGNILVDEDATLTIEPGVEVRFRQFRRLTVEGELVANGTAAQPIVFTGTSKAPGWWDGIYITGKADAPLTNPLNYVILEYGGSSTASLYLTHATVPIANSIVRYSGHDGIYGYVNGLAHLTNVELSNNGGFPYEQLDGGLDPQLAGITATGNVSNAIGLGAGTYFAEALWENVGLPYTILGNILVEYGAELTIEPGVEVHFTQFRRLTVEGKLEAAGMTDAPILFTGTTKAPGWWDSIYISGNSMNQTATANLDHTIVEYGGSSTANIFLTYAFATIQNSIIRNSGDDGVYVYVGGAGSVIERNQILNNSDYGVYNVEPSKTVNATNNWWGNASGPTYVPGTNQVNCHETGTGQKVSPGVGFRPFLTSDESDPTVILPGDMRLLTLTPERWYAPADNVTIIYFDIVLRDGAGQPLPGRQVRLNSTLGTVTDGGITDVNGRARAQLKSNTPGNATVIATLDAQTQCESATSPEAVVTFTDQPDDVYLKGSQAPYMSGAIQVDPEPIMRGVPTRLSARLTNPNDFPVVINGEFRYVQSSIGLAFDPVGQVQNREIPPNGELVVDVEWVPTVAGHYCFVFEYTAIELNGEQITNGSGRAQRNVNVAPGPMLNQFSKNSIDKARRANDAIQDGQFIVSALKDTRSVPGGFLQGIMVGNILDFIYEAGGGANCALAGGTSCQGWNGPRMKMPGDSFGNLSKDPPRQDYTTVATPETFEYPRVTPSATMPAARAEAINAYLDASFEMLGYLVATVVTYDRYAGASEADNLQWSSVQANAYVHYLTESAKAMINVADKLEALKQQLQSEGFVDLEVTAADYAAYQERLRTQGFNAQELEAAAIAGLTEEGIQEALNRRISLDPNEVAGSVFAGWDEIIAAMRQAGTAILTPPFFGASVGGRAGRFAAEDDLPNHDLVRIYESTTSIQVGNPTDATATVDLRVRPIDLPPDWQVTVSPQAVELDPGEQTTVTVTFRPGTATVQGTQPRVAVEGFIGDELIGGVAVDVHVPTFVPFDEELLVPVFLPEIHTVE